ncbi:RNA polymerase III subunit C82 [Mucor velutinosus]|uniref:RNA polymerase III subunit C82 n=1 Tax=Mucor velutinosus TaxID=708070 RepID=A0AAN7D3C8_9FUNG|nr:RNA polymerase III subunit C82 [Mucor velutinosus]
MNKKVQFSCDVEFVSTFANEDYDRTAQEVAKLTYKDMLELLTMKSQWRRDMERMMAERATVEEEDIVESTSNNSTSRLYNVQEICI